ncbi:hypothetical protein VR41_13745, partial [Streptomyces sp. NRRL B-1568]
GVEAGGAVPLWTRSPPPPPPHPPGVTAPQQPGNPAPGNPAPDNPAPDNPSAPEPSNPANPPPAAPAAFDVNGTYNGTLNGAACAAPECFVDIAKQSDPTGPGPGPDQAGHVTITLTEVNYAPAFNGVASLINEKLGPMDAALLQDGTVQGSGTTTDTDTSPGGSTRTAPYTVSGSFKNGTTGSPSYTLTLTLDSQYNLTGVR